MHLRSGKSLAAAGSRLLMGAALNMFLAFMVLAGSALPLLLINLQTIPLALSAVAAAALLAQALMQ
jgi:hypothetical protein